MLEDIVIDPEWSFHEAVQAATDRFLPGSMVGGKARVVLIQSWTRMVGQRRAMQEIQQFIDTAGSKSEAAKQLIMAPGTFNALIEYVRRLPDEGLNSEPIKLRKGAKRLFHFLLARKQHEVVSLSEILGALHWTLGTFQTYLRKNMLNNFFEQIDENTFRVLTDPNDVSEALVATTFSQVQNDQFYITPGESLKAEKGKYRLIRRLGNGAVGHVWEGLNVATQAKVALKVLNPRRDLLKPEVIPNVKRRFSRESRNGKLANHNHIVRYLDHGNYKGFPFLVMELASQSIGNRLASTGKVSVQESIRIIRDCLLGLAYLHESKCVHRDVKPDNILAFEDKYVLGDLGIVKWSDYLDEFISAGTITKNDMRLGSWYYMAPEQNENPASATPASDMYALGVTWHEILTLDHMNPAKIASGFFPDPSSVSGVNEIIRNMLSYDPGRRWTAIENLSRIETILKGFSSI